MRGRERGPSVRALADALAASRAAQTDRREAQRLLASALETAPDEPEVVSAAARASGLLAATSGDLEAAAGHLRRAARVADRGGLVERGCEARITLAYVLLLTTGSRAALRELARAEAMRPTGLLEARLHMQRGLVLQEIHLLVEAEDSLERAVAVLAVAPPDPLLEGDLLTNRAIVRSMRGDWAGANADQDAAEDSYTRAGHLARIAMLEHNRGTTAARRGDLPAALAAFATAEQGFLAAGMDPGLLSVERAQTLLSAGLAHEALEAATEAVAQFERNHNQVDVVQARLTLAEAAILGRNFGLAGHQAELARIAARRQRRPRWAALAGYVRVRARWLAGTVTPAALAEARRSATELRAADWAVQAADARLVAARIALALGRPGQARKELAAVGSTGRRGPAELRARAFHAEALLRRTSGDAVGAARSVRSGLRVLDELQAGLGASDLRAHAAGHTSELARLGVELALESGRPRAVLAAAERARATSLRFRSARPPDDEALVADLAALREVEAEIGADGGPSAALLARRTAIESAIRDRARHAAGEGQAAVAGSAPALEATVKALGDRTLVEYVEAAGCLHAVTVHRGRCRLHRLGPVAEVEGELERLVAGLHWLTVGRSADAVVRLVTDCSSRLDALLLAPVGASRGALVIVPTGALASLPWSLLPSCAGRAVSVAPSVALWTRAATAPSTGSGVLLAHGPGLEHAAAEVRAIARIRPDAARLVGRKACAADVLAAMDGTATTHLATHGTFRADNPMFSQLHLADGPLTVYDLERLAVPPRQVVLASCDSARSGVVGGEEVLGLAAVLLSLGTQVIVAATLPVPDAASRTLMVGLHRHLAAGLAMAEALTRARADLLRDPSPAALVAAAGYQCLGAG